MPEAWNKKRERQYQHVKDSAEGRGESEDTAEEIAARTVNKARAQQGESEEASKLDEGQVAVGARRRAFPLRRPGTHQGPAVRGRQATGRRGAFDAEQGRAEEGPRRPGATGERAGSGVAGAARPPGAATRRARRRT